MNCWICGKPAETGEHKIKKSLLTALHGSGPYVGARTVSHIKDGRETKLQGPNSSKLKYGTSICADCNNHKTQPFDFAYDQFFQFVLKNEPQILKYRVIDFADVYGAGFETKQTDLFKYFVKLLGCDLAHSGMPVPEDLKELLSKAHFVTELKISFAVNEDMLLIPGAYNRSAGIGDLLTSQRNLSQKDDPTYRWNTYFSFLHIYYWYLWEPDGPYGAPWIADSRYLYLGSFHPLTPDMRADVKRRIEQSGLT